MIKKKRTHLYSFISVLLSGILFLPGSVENCTNKKFDCKGMQMKRLWYCNGFICYLLNTTTQEVVVSFSKPPKHYGFTEFEVTLKNKAAGRKQKVYIAEYNHTFTNVISGVYQIWVMPYRGRDYCSQCKTISTEYFTVEFATGELVTTDQFAKSTTSEDSVSKANTQRTTTDDSVHVTKERLIMSSTTKPPTAKSPTTKTTTGEKSLSEAHSPQPTNASVPVAKGIVGSVLCIALVVATACCYNRRRSAGDEKARIHTPRQTDPAIDSTVTMELENVLLNNHNVEKINLQRRPKLFLLYEEDHRLHREVVDNFTLYLQNYCYCNVMSGYLHLDTTWVHQDIQDADYVIIVNSKLTYDIYKSILSKNQEHKENRRYTENGSSGIVPGINCILQKFLQQPSYDKIVMVYFDYTNENYIIPEICSGYNYKLMKNFTELLLYIHKLKRTDDLTQYDLPLDGEYYLKPTGKDLQNVIRNAAAYERENSDGFNYTYPNLRSISSTSDESGFGPGLQQEPIPYYFVSSHFQNHMDSVSQDVALTPPVLTEYRKTTSDGTYVYKSVARKYHDNQFDLKYEGQRNYIACMSNETSTAAEFGQIDFFPPDDDVSEFETASVSQSEQMMKINARYFEAEDDDNGYN